jgi:sodium-dependent dicarboxylate transporter 2/3/5
MMTFLTELTSNTAVTTIMMPVLAATAISSGVHPFLFMIPAAMSASCAFMLPVATPPNAIVFGSGYITIPRMAKTGLVLNLIGVVLVSLCAYLLAVPIFGITIG